MAFKIFSKFCFLTALPVMKRSTNHQMVMTKPKMLIIKLFAPMITTAFCTSWFVVAAPMASIAAPAMTIIKIMWARKRASFSTPSQICLVIKLRVYRHLPLDCLGFKLNLSRHKAVYAKRTKDEAPHPKDKDRRL